VKGRLSWRPLSDSAIDLRWRQLFHCLRVSERELKRPNPATGKKDVVWFALNDDRLLFAFAGIWTEFRGERGTKSKPIPGPHLISMVS
jgi:hypothetical protein